MIRKPKAFCERSLTLSSKGNILTIQFENAEEVREVYNWLEHHINMPEPQFRWEQEDGKWILKH